jgi:uncharacterized protein
LVTATREFQIRGSQQAVWDMMNDPKKLGECVPGCEEVIVLGDNESRWKMKMNIGVISRRIDAKARVTRRVEPENLDISLESSDGDLKGRFTINLKSAGPDVTSIAFTADMDARGSFQWVVNQVIKSQLDGFIDKFNQCISRKLELPKP